MFLCTHPTLHISWGKHFHSFLYFFFMLLLPPCGNRVQHQWQAHSKSCEISRGHVERKQSFMDLRWRCPTASMKSVHWLNSESVVKDWPAATLTQRCWHEEKLWRVECRTMAAQSDADWLRLTLKASNDKDKNQIQQHRGWLMWWASI